MRWPLSAHQASPARPSRFARDPTARLIAPSSLAGARCASRASVPARAARPSLQARSLQRAAPPFPRRAIGCGDPLASLVLQNPAPVAGTAALIEHRWRQRAGFLTAPLAPTGVAQSRRAGPGPAPVPLVPKTACVAGGAGLSAMHHRQRVPDRAPAAPATLGCGRPPRAKRGGAHRLRIRLAGWRLPDGPLRQRRILARRWSPPP